MSSSYCDVPCHTAGRRGCKRHIMDDRLIGRQKGVGGHPGVPKARAHDRDAEMVTFEFPLLVRVTLNRLLPPTFTLPKLKLAGSLQAAW
jgi:hypothetical protein